MRLPAISCVRNLKKNDNRGGEYKKQQQFVDSRSCSGLSMLILLLLLFLEKFLSESDNFWIIRVVVIYQTWVICKPMCERLLPPLPARSLADAEILLEPPVGRKVGTN